MLLILPATLTTNPLNPADALTNAASGGIEAAGGSCPTWNGAKPEQ